MRDWVLAISMDTAVDQSLSRRTCDHCGAATYEANLACHNCKTARAACAVTGYPIPPGELVSAKGNPNVVARRDDFNTYVSKFKTDPIAGTVQNPIY